MHKCFLQFQKITPNLKEARSTIHEAEELRSEADMYFIIELWVIE